MTMLQPSSPHRHFIVTRNLLVFNDLQPGDDDDDENRFFSCLAPWQNTKNREMPLLSRRYLVRVT